MATFLNDATFLLDALSNFGEKVAKYSRKSFFVSLEELRGRKWTVLLLSGLGVGITITTNNNWLLNVLIKFRLKIGFYFGFRFGVVSFRARKYVSNLAFMKVTSDSHTQ